MMSKKDYVKVAAIIAGERASPAPASTVLDNITRSMAYMFAQDNPRFDRSRFYVACGLDAS